MKTIKEIIKLVSENKADDINLWTYFGDFLDSFYHKDTTEDERYESIKEEPEQYANIDKETYAFIAGAVHKICNDYSVRIPEWVGDRKYILDEPYFSLNAKGNLRLVLIMESPVEFKIRNIFTSENTLNRV